MAANRAAWLTEPKATFLKIDSAEMPTPGPDEVVIANKAIAINPIEWKMVDYGMFIPKYPHILGSDLSGTVHEVGTDVSTLRKGDRITGHSTGLVSGIPEEGTYQLYTRCHATTIAKIPDSMSFIDAVVLPISISTASLGLYQKGGLELPLPSFNPAKTGKVILIWGGATSIGSSTTQLATASGVTVITTASPRNFAYCRDLGASTVIDYNAADAVQQVLTAIKSTDAEFAGIFDAVAGPPSFKAVFEIAQQAAGRKRISFVLPPPDDRPDDVEIFNINSPNAATTESNIGKPVWQDYVPQALEKGVLRCLPEPLIVGKGLESLYKGMQTSKQGVSAKKVVVEL
ncbi:hypothetical protein ANO11243_057060 [Dothideomycetidae sp. 11243]|nr:hypothetical protein ANO11243_057060 [fungal sp. No.11243]